MSKKKHKPKGTVTRAEKDMLRNMNDLPARKYPKVNRPKLVCPSCGFERMYKAIRCPSCEAKQ